MTVRLYGIKNCDTIKKAKKWLEGKHIEFQFHDFRVEGIDRKLIESWLKQVDWQVLLNTRGTTWRKLPEDKRQGINKSSAVKLMLEQPAIIKRPVLAVKNNFYVGFKDKDYEQIFK
ncbi:MAG: ArsC family reductase [Gammaproteobacteria bacterium]|nr:ArsC family reductase [Gammaproteobacteria bacterium]